MEKVETKMDFEKNWALIEEYQANRDEILLELINDLISQALKYARMRLDWYGFSREERADKDSLRSSIHDRFIDNLNILNRYLTKEGMEALATDDDRKIVGDFACSIAYQVALEMR